MNTELLKLLYQNSKYTAEELAAMLGSDTATINAQIKELEDAGLICGYKAVIDWEKVDGAFVSALIELKVTPQPDAGFEDTAKKIMKFKEVETVYLMSGGYDLCVIVKGKTFQEVAMFVGKVLAPMKNVISTATHFVLRRYKELDVILCGDDKDDRGAFWL